MAPPKFFGASLKTTTKYFFDRDKVIKAMNRKERAAMMFIGGTLRKTAQRSIRKPTKQNPASKPGQPVRSQTGIYKKSILFEYEPTRHAVICGPKKLPLRSTVQPTNRRSVPELLEKGGRAVATKPTYKFVKRKKRQPQNSNLKRNEVIKIPAGSREYDERPTMQLAHKKTITNKKLKRAFGVIGFRTR